MQRRLQSTRQQLTKTNSRDVIFAVADVYVDAFKEIYGDDFSVDKLTYVNDNTISYEGKEISWDYVDELVYNSMTNKF